MPQRATNESTGGDSATSETHHSDSQESQRSQDQNPGSGTGGGERTFEFEYNGRKFGSQQELNTYLNTLNSTVREQGRALNRFAEGGGSQGFQPQGRPADAPQPPAGQPAQNADFWNDPVGVLRSEMHRIIEPFQRDLQQSRVVTSRQQLMQEFPDYGDYEQMIVAQLSQGGTPQTYENLKGAYYMVKGYMLSTGQIAPQQQEAPPPQGQQQNQQPNGGNAPPQHRPSNAPIPTPQNQQRKRQLTENERHLARLAGMSDDQYLAWLELDETGVVDSRIGIPEGGAR
jgi:hypothetical protein